MVGAHARPSPQVLAVPGPTPRYDRFSGRRWCLRCCESSGLFSLQAAGEECAEHGVMVEHIPCNDGKGVVACAASEEFLAS